MRIRVALDIEVEDPAVVDYLCAHVTSNKLVATDDGPEFLANILVDALVAAIAPERPDDRQPVADHIYYKYFEEGWMARELGAEWR